MFIHNSLYSFDNVGMKNWTHLNVHIRVDIPVKRLNIDDRRAVRTSEFSFAWSRARHACHHARRVPLWSVTFMRDKIIRLRPSSRLHVTIVQRGIREYPYSDDDNEDDDEEGGRGKETACFIPGLAPKYRGRTWLVCEFCSASLTNGLAALARLSRSGRAPRCRGPPPSPPWCA